MWAEHEDFLKVVKAAWERPVRGDPFFRVVQKLKPMKVSFKKWNIEVFGRVDKKSGEYPMPIVSNSRG